MNGIAMDCERLPCMCVGTVHGCRALERGDLLLNGEE